MACHGASCSRCENPETGRVLLYRPCLPHVLPSGTLCFFPCGVWQLRASSLAAFPCVSFLPPWADRVFCYSAFPARALEATRRRLPFLPSLIRRFPGCVQVIQLLENYTRSKLSLLLAFPSEERVWTASSSASSRLPGVLLCVQLPFLDAVQWQLGVTPVVTGAPRISPHRHTFGAGKYLRRKYAGRKRSKSR